LSAAKRRQMGTRERGWTSGLDKKVLFFVGVLRVWVWDGPYGEEGLQSAGPLIGTHHRKNWAVGERKRTTGNGDVEQRRRIDAA